MSLYSGTVAFLHRSSCPWARGRCPARQPESGGNVGGSIAAPRGGGRPAATSSKSLDRQSALALNGRPGPLGRAGVRNMGAADLGRVGVDVGMAAPRWGGRPAATSNKLYALTACRRWLSTVRQNRTGVRNMGPPFLLTALRVFREFVKFVPPPLPTWARGRRWNRRPRCRAWARGRRRCL